MGFCPSPGFSPWCLFTIVSIWGGVVLLAFLMLFDVITGRHGAVLRVPLCYFEGQIQAGR